MPERSPQQDQQTRNDPDQLFPGRTEWLVDTLDQKPPEKDGRAKRGFPCGTLLLLAAGIAIIGALAWLLIGPPLPGAVAPIETNTPTATVAVPTSPPATPVPALLPTPTALPSPTISAPFGIGERVAISGTGPTGVRLRAGAGLDFLTQGIYNDGDAFFVMPNVDPGTPYPVQADGYTWWRLRASDGLIGWTAQEFLKPAPLVGATSTATTTP